MSMIALLLVVMFLLLLVMNVPIAVSIALAMEQTTPALGWKMGYVYLALPISGFFMILFTLENLIETLATPAPQLHEADAAEEVE